MRNVTVVLMRSMFQLFSMLKDDRKSCHAGWGHVLRITYLGVDQELFRCPLIRPPRRRRHPLHSLPFKSPNDIPHRFVKKTIIIYLPPTGVVPCGPEPDGGSGEDGKSYLGSLTGEGWCEGDEKKITQKSRDERL